MSQIMQAFRWLWTVSEPAVPQGEALTLLAAGALRSISVGLLFWAVLFVICVQPFFVVRKLASVFTLSAVIVSLSASLFCLRRGRVRLAGWIFLIAMWVVLTVFTALSGGITSPALGYGLGIIATAAWLLGRRTALLSACVFAAIAFALAVLAQAGFSPPRYLPSPPLVTWALLVGFVIITTLPLNRVLYTLRQTLLQSEHRVEDLMRAEQALRASEERYRALIETSPDAITVTDLQGHILMCSQQTAAMHGYGKPEELVRQSAFELIVPEDRERATSGMISTLQGNVLRNAQYTLRRADGSAFPGELSSSLIRHPDGSPAALMAVSRDITGRKRLEAEMHQAQKMESIGLLAGGVAHDFNNLLTVIRCYCHIALAELSDPDAACQSLEEVEKAAEKASVLTGQLLAFSRKQVFRPQVLNLNSIIIELEKMLRCLIGAQIEVVTDLDPTLGNTKVDPSQTEQVLMNLVVNARDAMPGGGRLVIETAGLDVPDDSSRNDSNLPPGSYVTVAVKDTGNGIDPEIVPRIFEPFFTTKGQGRGTGLGLSVVYGIVRQNSGEIRVESEIGRGTTFQIYFPRTDEKNALQKTARPELGGSRGMETVLVVDDEARMTSLVSEVLQRQGYSVLCAAGGDEALRICADHPKAIHLLLTDVEMPGMNGDELAKRAEPLRPGMRVLYMSGYTDSAVLNTRLLTPLAFFPKPFAPAELVRRVRVILDAPSPKAL